MLDSLTADSFAPHSGTIFRIRGTDAVDLRLITVERLGKRSPGAQREPFSLLFVGPAGRRLPQQIYRLEHETLGTLEIFIVPIGPGADGERYEAIFT